MVAHISSSTWASMPLCHYTPSQLLAPFFFGKIARYVVASRLEKCHIEKKFFRYNPFCRFFYNASRGHKCRVRQH